MTEIIIKQVLDNEGYFSHLELWQDNQHIKISLANTAIDNKPYNFKWTNLRNILDDLEKEVRLQIEKKLNYGFMSTQTTVIEDEATNKVQLTRKVQ